MQMEVINRVEKVDERRHKTTLERGQGRSRGARAWVQSERVRNSNVDARIDSMLLAVTGLGCSIICVAEIGLRRKNHSPVTCCLRCLSLFGSFVCSLT